MRRVLVSALSVFLATLATLSAGACSDTPTSGPPPSTTDGSPNNNNNNSNGEGGTGSDAPVEPSGPPALAFVGRFDMTDPNAPKAGWPGTRIIARFDGTTAVSVKLDENPEPEGPSEWDVIIDGKADDAKKLVLEAGSHDYELAKDLSPGVHVVEIYKRSEAQNGVTTFLGFDLKQGKLLAPPIRPTRKIEIIGDSAASAYGSEGVGMGPDCPGEDQSAKYQNFRHSFGAVLGETFKADVHGTVFSGKGFSKNIWRPDTETLSKLFPRSNPSDSESAWDLTKWIPDVVVIMAGGNDFAIGQPTDDGPATLEDFTTAYGELVTTIRVAYPQAHVFLTVSGSVTDGEPPGRDTRTNIKNGIAAIITDRTSKGDTRVYSAEPPPANEATELTGCDAHGSPQYHVRIANDLATPIRQKAGW